MTVKSRLLHVLNRSFTFIVQLEKVISLIRLRPCGDHMKSLVFFCVVPNQFVFISLYLKHLYFILFKFNNFGLTIRLFTSIIATI